MAELHTVGISAVLPADAQLDSWTRLAPFLDRHLDQLSNARLVDCGERVLLDDFQFLVRPEEGARVVPAHAQAGLRQIVGAKAEKLGRLRNLIGRERTTRNLD